MFHIKVPVTEDSEVTEPSYNGVIQDWSSKSVAQVTILCCCCAAFSRGKKI